MIQPTSTNIYDTYLVPTQALSRDTYLVQQQLYDTYLVPTNQLQPQNAYSTHFIRYLLLQKWASISISLVQQLQHHYWTTEVCWNMCFLHLFYFYCMYYEYLLTFILLMMSSIQPLLGPTLVGFS